MLRKKARFLVNLHKGKIHEIDNEKNCKVFPEGVVPYGDDHHHLAHFFYLRNVLIPPPTI